MNTGEQNNSESGNQTGDNQPATALTPHQQEADKLPAILASVTDAMNQLKGLTLGPEYSKIMHGLKHAEEGLRRRVRDVANHIGSINTSKPE